MRFPAYWREGREACEFSVSLLTFPVDTEELASLCVPLCEFYFGLSDLLQLHDQERHSPEHLLHRRSGDHPDSL